MADQLYTCTVIIAWFVANISLVNITKWLYMYGKVCTSIGGKEHCQTYEYPIAITCLHMVCSWLLCHIYLQYFAAKDEDNERLHLLTSATSSMQSSSGLRLGKGSPRVVSQRKVFSLACCFALCVAMGNASLKYVYPSFNQMLGSMSPLITVLMSVVLTDKSYNWWTWFAMPIICGGLILCSAKEPNFNMLGTGLAVGAAVLRALKSVMQEKLLTDPSEKLDAVTLLYYMAPHAGLLLLVASLLFEGLGPLQLLVPFSRLASGAPTPAAVGRVSGVPMLVLWLGLSGINACILNVVGNQVTKLTSAVMLQVLGNIKCCLGILISVAIFRNAMQPMQVVGIAVCLLGVWIYQIKGAVISKNESGPSLKASA
mmetsp:Transcript_46282/g.110132  ORF Transcript_46282/g.110132 Transcript_46282/m.110132 type:complete len:370 (+) Transcript_46282:127-1236(+)